ncbi:expression site-associated protein 5, putative [Leishmania tarentolae]|uniref:Expression site-associated protein 5, putative n=1 Tax=Leishmania tarentolae TaxID=5689 RepID=A0A640KSF3_LEITA|nr:expression site-associated protein 5, putative [Leishmania tarentolae]
MKLYGKRNDGGSWALRRSLCLLWLVWLFAVLYGFRVLQSMHRDPLSDIRTVVDKGVSECRSANVSVAVTSTLMNAFVKAAIIPMVENEGNGVIVAEEEVNHIWVDKMMLRHFKVGSLFVRTAVPDAQSMAVHATGLGVEVNKSRFIFHYMGVKCSGTFWASMKETALDAVMHFTLLPEGRWNVSFPHLKLDWGQVDIHHELDTKACNFAQEVVELLTGELDVVVLSQVKKTVNREIPRKAAEGLNHAFDKVGIRAITPPVMTTDSMAVTLDLNSLNSDCASAPTTSTVPNLVSRDLALRTTVTSVNNALYNMVQAHRLYVEKHLSAVWNTTILEEFFPELYQACPECRLYMRMEATKAPALEVVQEGEVSAVVQDLVVGMYVQPNTTQHSSALSFLIKRKQLSTTAGFSAMHRFLERNKRVSSRYPHEPIPVLAIGCSAVLGVRNISADAGDGISYEVLPVRDVSVKVVASNIGDVKTEDLQKIITKVWNDFAAPVANSESPLKLPFFFQEAVLKLGSDTVEGGVNVNLQEEFTQAVLWDLPVDHGGEGKGPLE